MTIVTLCGSMRFYEQILQVAAEETVRGNIVLAPFSVVAQQDQDGEVKSMLDRLHFQKIDMAERVIFVTDQNGYIGDSTRREMVYALSKRKVIDTRKFDIPVTVSLPEPAVITRDGVRGWRWNDIQVFGFVQVWPDGIETESDGFYDAVAVLPDHMEHAARVWLAVAAKMRTLDAWKVTDE